MLSPNQNETPVWVIPVVLLVGATVLVVLLMRALQQYEDMPFRRPGPRSPQAGEGAPSRSPGPEGNPSCSRAANGHSPVASRSDTSGQGTGRVATVRLENIQGGYSFRHSPDWRVEKSGRITRIIGPEHSFVVSFGPGPSGGLPSAYEQFTELIRETYSGVQLRDIKVGCASGDLAATTRGEGVNRRGKDFHFLAVLIKPSAGHSVGAFGAWRPRARHMREAVEEVMGSFEAVRSSV